MPAVLHILPALPFGGLQKLAIDLAAEQCARGYDARILTLYEDARCEAYLQRYAVPYQCTPGQRLSVLGCGEYLHALRTFQPDLVHLHSGVLWSNLLALPVKRCPWVYHVHMYPHPPTSLKRRLLHWSMQQLCDVYVGTSAFMSTSIQPYVNGAPVYTVHNGIRVPADRSVPVRPPAEPPCYGVATRLGRGKGVLEFVEVAAAIAARQPEARFRLAGDGPLEADVRARVRQHGLIDRFDLVGFVQDVDAFYRSLDAVIFTSPREAFGLGIVEPMGVGTPVAAYLNRSGSDEIIEHGVNGLQAPWNDVDALASHAMRLARDTDERTRIVRNALAAVREQFSLRAMTDHMDAVYLDVLGPGCIPSPQRLPELHVS